MWTRVAQVSRGDLMTHLAQISLAPQELGVDTKHQGCCWRKSLRARDPPWLKSGSMPGVSLPIHEGFKNATAKVESSSSATAASLKPGIPLP
jgi:hypothetical protein